MRNSPFWWVLIGFMILLDVYFFQAIRLVTQNASSKTRMIVFSVYWIISIGAIILLILLPYLRLENMSKAVSSTVFAIIVGLFFAKLIACLFFLIDDIRRGIQWIAGKIGGSRSPDASELGEDKLSRSAFFSWTGMILGGGLFGTLLYGFSNKYKYQLKRHQLAFSSLPDAFRGLRIVHISDIHSGSFNDKEGVLKGIEKIMQEKPDLILFTGDLVNNKAEEMDNYMDVFSQLNAPMGVYSTLGNHDYGDYVNWENAEQKQQNLERLKQVHKDLGWRLLLDEHVSLEKDGEKIALLGVQNISGRGNFHSYGDLKKAHSGSEDHPFKILMSHDPSHWDADVRKNFSDIDLTLSGHTHGFQFGLEIPGFKWSPVQYVYRQWAGLYEMDHQKLYINRGYGFIGYPGRVGILPEITVIELA